MSQTCHEPRYLPRANQACSASETRRDKLAADYLAFIQCLLHLCRLTAPECLLRTKSLTNGSHASACFSSGPDQTDAREGAVSLPQWPR